MFFAEMPEKSPLKALPIEPNPALILLKLAAFAIP